MNSLREKVELRAGCRCEYCRAPQGICAYTFHIEHIIPRAQGGSNHTANCALACFSCNNAKAIHTTGIDPETRSEVALFHPRKQRWDDHFAWSKDFTRVEGRTAVGRATVLRLRMNERLQMKARPLWVRTGTWP